VSRQPDVVLVCSIIWSLFFSYIMLLTVCSIHMSTSQFNLTPIFPWATEFHGVASELCTSTETAVCDRD